MFGETIHPESGKALGIQLLKFSEWFGFIVTEKLTLKVVLKLGI